MGVAELIQPLGWNAVTLSAAGALLLPFISFLVLIGASQKLRKMAGILASGVMGLSFVLSLFVAFQVWENQVFHTRFDWFNLSSLHSLKLTAGIRVDNLTVIMLLVVTSVSFLVHIFSLAYMKGDKHYTRYFAYLGLFTFNMLGLVLSDNLLVLFVFWELVGFASYLLIGFWYEKPAANRAGSKAFLVNRIGDVGFLLAILILWSQFHTLDLQALTHLIDQSVFEGGSWLSKLEGAESAVPFSSSWLMVAALCLFAGVLGKSAQFPLMAWLPDAMEGPTPVSALIHAATMVAAGVYLLARIFFLIDLAAHEYIAFTGALTAFMGAVAAFTRHDIKKVLAFSTISQLGYMVMGMGVGAYSASLFHLMTHAFFKAGLFLAAGSVIYMMHHLQRELKAKDSKVLFDAQDMRFMGGLGRKMPITFIAYLTSTLALAGVPFFSGFLSKDAILVGAMAWAKVMSADGNWHYFIVPVLSFAAALMTAMYMGRQILLVFFGEFRLEQLSEDTKDISKSIKEGPLAIKFPLLVLAVMSLGFFYALNPLSSQNAWFLQAIKLPEVVAPAFDAQGFFERILEVEGEVQFAVFIITSLCAVLGFAWAYNRYRPQSIYTRNYLQRGEPENLFQKISFHNWYLDDLYKGITVLTRKTAGWLAAFDVKVVDGLVNGMAHLNQYISKKAAQADYKLVDGAVRTFGLLNVIVAHIVAFFDRHFIDGIVNGMAYLSGKIGQLTRSVQNGQVQWYFVCAILGLLVVLLTAFI